MKKGVYSTKTLTRGDKVGPYTIVRRVPGGVGGMATVYEARLGGKGPSVALKIAHAGLGGVLKDEAAFVTALELNHPHIIKIVPTAIGEGTSEYIVKDPQIGCWYFAMEFMAGGSLDDWLQRRKRVPFYQAVRVLSQVGSALDAAHQAGIVHLDVKSSNVLFRQQPGKGELHAVLTDFGIARPQGRTAVSAQTTFTIEYASPEQVRSAQGEQIEIGPASDVYSLAVICYEMIAGHLPYRSKSDLSLMHHIVYEEPPLPVPFGPPQLTPIMARALAKDPEERYSSVAAFVTDLKAVPTKTFRAQSIQPWMPPLVGLVLGLTLGLPIGRHLWQEQNPEVLLRNLTPSVVTVVATAPPMQQLFPSHTPTSPSEPTPTATDAPTIQARSTEAPTPTATFVSPTPPFTPAPQVSSPTPVPPEPTEPSLSLPTPVPPTPEPPTVVPPEDPTPEPPTPTLAPPEDPTPEPPTLAPPEDPTSEPPTLAPP